MRIAMGHPFSLHHTLTCGQAFRWQARGEWFSGVVGSYIVRARDSNGELEVDSRADGRVIRDYFRADDDFSEILRSLRSDRVVSRAAALAPGLRVLRQEPWECLVSYITSIASNIPKITRTIENVCGCFGRRLDSAGETLFAFPDPESLSSAPLRRLRACGLGFRARYVSAVSKYVAKERMDLVAFRRASYEEARRELVRLPGVGEKVADCVCLFSLDKLEAFPIDRWIRRVMVKEYLRRESSDAHIRSYAHTKFGAYAGYAQEYLYSYARALRFKRG